MKLKTKNVLLVIAGLALAYLAGSFWGFPPTQNHYVSGNIGKATKQQDQVNAAADVKLAEKFQSDTAYRKSLLVDLTMLYIQTQTTTSTVENMKKEILQIRDLKPYAAKFDNVIETGKNLTQMLNDCLAELKEVSEDKPVDNLSLKISQSVNIFQIFNSRISELDGFMARSTELSKQKKLNDNLIKLCSSFTAESASIASACGDNVRAKGYLGTVAHENPIDGNFGNNGCGKICGSSIVSEAVHKLTYGFSKEDRNSSTGTVSSLNDKIIDLTH